MSKLRVVHQRQTDCCRRPLVPAGPSIAENNRQLPHALKITVVRQSSRPRKIIRRSRNDRTPRSDRVLEDGLLGKVELQPFP